MAKKAKATELPGVVFIRAAADWRAGAEARLAVESALSALRASAVAGLLAAGG